MAEGRKQLILEYVIQAQNQAASVLAQQNAILAAMQKQIEATAKSSVVMSQGFEKLDKSITAVGVALQKQTSGLSQSVSGHTSAGKAAKSHGDALDKLTKQYATLDSNNARVVKGFSTIQRGLSTLQQANVPVVGAFNALNKAVQTNAAFMQQHGAAWNTLASQFKVGAQITPQLTAQLNALGKAFQNVAAAQRGAAAGGGGGRGGLFPAAGGGGGGAGGFGNLASGAAAFGAQAQSATTAATALGAATFKLTTLSVAAGQALFELAKNAVQSVINSFKEGIELSSRFQNTFLGLETVARSFGQSATDVTQAARDLASDGLMRMDEAAVGLRNLLMTGFGLPEAIQLMKGFKDIAAFNRQASLEFGYAITSATEGIKNQNSILVDNAGLTKNLSIIMKEAGLQLSDLARVSSDAAVRAKFFSGLMKEMSFSAGDAAKLMETFSGSVSRFRVQIQLALVALGDTITKNVAVREAFSQLSELVVEFTRAITANQQAIGTFIAVGLNPLLAGFTAVGSLVVKTLDLFARANKVNLDISNQLETGFISPLTETNALVLRLAELMREVKIAVAVARQEFDLFIEQFKSEAGSLFDAWDRIKAAISAVSERIQYVIAEFGSPIWNNIKDTIAAIGSFFGTLIDVISDVVEWLTTLTHLWRGLGAVLNAIISVIKFVFTTLEALLKLLQWFFQETSVGKAIVYGLGETLKGFGLILESTADFVSMVADAWDRLAYLWRTAKPPALPAPPAGFQPQGFTNPNAAGVAAAETKRFTQEAEANAAKFIEVFKKVDAQMQDTSKLNKKWLKENADGLARIAGIAQTLKLPHAEALNAMAVAARKAGEAVVDVGKGASKAKSDLEQFQESVKELSDDLAEASRNGLNTEQMLRIFGSQINSVVAGAERFPKVQLAKSIRDVIDAMDAEKVRKFANQLINIAEIPSEWGRLGDKFKVFTDSIAAVGGAAQVSQTWLLANAEAILKIALTAEGQAVPALQELADRIRALTAANEDFARSQRIATNQVNAWEKVNQEMGDTIERQIDLQDELFKFGRQTVEQQIRDTQKNLRNELRAIDDREDAFKEYVRNLEPELRKQKAAQINATIEAFEEERRLLRAHADLQIAETYGVSQDVIRIWADAARKIAVEMEKARSAGSPGGVLVTPEEQERIEQMNKDFEYMRRRMLEILKIMQPILDKWATWERHASNIANLLNALGFEGIAADITRIVGALKTAEDSAKQIALSFELIRQGKWLEGIQGMIAGVAQAIGAFKQATDSASRIKNALGGAAVGAKIGEAAGQGIGFVLGGPVGAAIGKVVGKWGGAIVGGIIGAFRKPAWAKIQDDVAKRFGVKVSEGLAKEIEATMKLVGDSFFTRMSKKLRGEPIDLVVNKKQVAEALNISKIIDEAGGLTATNVGKFAQEITVLFSRVEAGGRDAGKAIDELNTFFNKMVAQIDRDFNGLVHPAMAQFIADAETAGVKIEALTDFLKKQAEQVVSGAAKITAGFTDPFTRGIDTIKEVTEEINDLAKKRRELTNELNRTEVGTAAYRELQRELDAVMKKFDDLVRRARDAQTSLNVDPSQIAERANRVGRLLEVSFRVAIENGQSFVETLKTIAPQIENIRVLQDKYGFAVSESLQRLFELSDWATAHPELANAIDGLNEMLKGLHNTGALTAQTFKDLGSEAVAQFQEMTQSGLAVEDIFRIMQPSLQTLYELQQRYGFELDANTQRLIDSAIASGSVGDAHKDASERMVDGLNKVVDRLDRLLERFGIHVPQAAQAAATNVANQAKSMGSNITEVTRTVGRFGSSLSRDIPKAAEQSALSIWHAGRSMRSSLQGATQEAENFWKTLWSGGEEAAAPELPVFDDSVFTMPPAIEDLNSGLEDAISNFNDLGATAEDSIQKITNALQSLRDDLTASTLSGHALDVFSLDRQHREAITQWLSSMEDESQAVIDEGIALINQTFANKMALLQRERGEQLRDIMFGLDEQLLELTLNKTDLAMHKLLVEQQQTIDKFMEDAAGASQDFITDGMQKIQQIFELRAKNLREAARGLTEIATQITPSITLLGDGLLRIQGADVVFSNLNRQLTNASLSASMWGANTVQQAGQVLDAINAVSFGHSPGGLKEIPDKLADAMDSARSFSRIYETEMDRIRRMVDDVGYAIDDRLTGDRHLNVGIDTQYGRSGTATAGNPLNGLGTVMQGGGQNVELHLHFAEHAVMVSGVNADNIEDKLVTALTRALTNKVIGNDKDAVRLVNVIRPSRGRW